MSEEKKFNIPPQGTLGVLALGHRGLDAWREVREKAKQQREENKSKNTDSEIKEGGNGE